jgi:hypothetical protein
MLLFSQGCLDLDVSGNITTIKQNGVCRTMIDLIIFIGVLLSDIHITTIVIRDLRNK